MLLQWPEQMNGINAFPKHTTFSFFVIPALILPYFVHHF